MAEEIAELELFDKLDKGLIADHIDALDVAARAAEHEAQPAPHGLLGQDLGFRRVRPQANDDCDALHVPAFAQHHDANDAIDRAFLVIDLARHLSRDIEIPLRYDVNTFNCPVLPRKQDDAVAKTFRYEGFDLITLQKLIERDYTILEPQTAEEVIGYYARRIAQDVKLPSQFSALAPKVREFLETKAFGGPVTLNEPAMIKAISSNVAQYVTVKTFAEALRKLVIAELEPQLLHAGRPLSETAPFPWSRATLAADKCMFNLVPCHNEFEREFAQLLQKAPDVQRFAKLPEQFGFSIEYTDNAGNLRYYEPDFVALTNDGMHYIAETKGLEDTNVANKDRAARLWCENATRLTGKPWAYLKVLQTAYKQLQPTEFEDLFVFRQGELFAQGRRIPELSVVALRHPVECKGGVLPEGGKGTVVHVYRDGEHYEVEFADPFPCTLTLGRGDIHPG